MEIAEPVSPPSLVELSDECPFDHELAEPPNVKNDLVGLGSTLASSMNSGRSTNVYGPYAPDEASKVKWGKLPQKNKEHVFFKHSANRGHCATVTFEGGITKKYPVSCSAHHLVPSQESLKDHPLLRYMCKKGTAGDNNHGYADGQVWSDVGYDTNGSENGVYLPGNYAVGGGRGGLNIWYPVDGADDSEHDDGYIDPDKMPPEEYKNLLLNGVKGQISKSNVCWQYVAQSTRLAPGQFHDRHFHYSDVVVKSALRAILENYQSKDIRLTPGACSKCADRQQKLKDLGFPAPYSIVKRLQTVSTRLRTYLTAAPGSWRENVYTSMWMQRYMQAVIAGGQSRADAEAFENG